jgi:hypothetical protein
VPWAGHSAGCSRANSPTIQNLSMRKMLRPFSAVLTKLRRGGRPVVDQTPLPAIDWPSREAVINGFRFLLGREPGNESAIDEHARIPSFAGFRKALLGSEEFRGNYKVMFPETYGHPSLTMGRETLAFIHLQKTGGTSLRTMLERQFPVDRRCPIRGDKLYQLSVAELGQYDFFSGHFDRCSLRFIPRNDIKTIALFREPRARLISFYRFLRSHPVRDEFANDRLMRLANELSAEEFFETAHTRAHVGVYNHYLIALGGSYAWFEYTRTALREQDFSEAMEEAKRQIRALTAIGITERFSQSVEVIWHALNFGAPPSTAAADVTDKLSEVDNRFQKVDPVAMTPRLAAALSELTKYDDELYRFAVLEFERRYTEWKRC